tara:strand:- start:613 stop:1008 length:396 start_codon:yes stop_codon:yes gene_type:complete
MHYTKAIVDLIQEARRRVPSEDKPNIKLANPDVLFELLKLYQKSTDVIFKALVKEVFNLAGDPWPGRLETKPEKDNKTAEDEASEGYFVKVYRGQTLLQRKATNAKSGESQNPDEPKASRPKRMYRGQVVA